MLIKSVFMAHSVFLTLIVNRLFRWRGPFVLLGLAWPLAGQIHSVPVVIKAKDLPAAQFSRIDQYRLFATNADGSVRLIPFQIDELDPYGDYILPEGPVPNSKYSNRIFEGNDELVFMGSDVGSTVSPSKWGVAKPDQLFQIMYVHPETDRRGAVYLGIYFDGKPLPPLSPISYVSFNLGAAEVVTSRFRYRFDRENYIVVRGVDIHPPREEPIALIHASTMFMRADLKYFLTIDLNHRDLSSRLEAYKVGPVRCTARVIFNYKLMRLNIDLGMYTEVSFYSNSVTLPAVIDNPLDSKRILNAGSQFYYGFAFVNSPVGLDISTNMLQVPQPSAGAYGKLPSSGASKDAYWFNVASPRYNIYVDMTPSQQMKANKTIPVFYRENVNGEQLASRSDRPALLGEAPVNLAIAMDISQLTEGLHDIAINLFVENRDNRDAIEEYRTISKWNMLFSKVNP